MNALAPPKTKRRLYGTALRELPRLGAYRANALLATIFGAMFWFFEQRRGQLADRIDNERSRQ